MIKRTKELFPLLTKFYAVKSFKETTSYNKRMVGNSLDSQAIELLSLVVFHRPRINITSTSSLSYPVLYAYLILFTAHVVTFM